MGLDIAEFVMELEDHFDIMVPEDEFWGTTVLEVARAVDRKLQDKDERNCYTGYCFHRLRDAATKACGLDRRRVRPSSLLQDIAPEGDKNRFYKKVRGGLSRYKGVLPQVGLLGRCPKQFSTIGDMARHMALRMSVSDMDGKAPYPSTILAVVKHLIAERNGMSVDKIGDDDKIVDLFS